MKASNDPGRVETLNEQAKKQNPLSRVSGRSKWLAKTGILSAAAIILMFLEFPLPLMPPFLKFDLSDVPALLAAFSLGPMAAVFVELIKNLMHLATSHTALVGELANFIVGASFVATAGLVYKRFKNRKGAIISMIVGTLAMTIVGCVANYVLTLPFYMSAYGLTIEKLSTICQAVGNHMVTDMKSLILWVFVPFNLIKGTVVSLLVLLMYKRLSPYLHL